MREITCQVATTKLVLNVFFVYQSSFEAFDVDVLLLLGERSYPLCERG